MTAAFYAALTLALVQDAAFGGSLQQNLHRDRLSIEIVGGEAHCCEALGIALDDRSSGLRHNIPWLCSERSRG